MIKRLEVQLSSVHCIEPLTNNQGEMDLRVVLLNVNTDSLMQSLIKEAGIEAILDNLNDDDIKSYMNRGKDE